MPQQQGLFGKFLIQKADGSPISPSAKYIVLRYDAESEDGSAARHAIIAYARFINQSNPGFSRDLIEEMKVESIKSYTLNNNNEVII